MPDTTGKPFMLEGLTVFDPRLYLSTRTLAAELAGRDLRGRTVFDGGMRKRWARTFLTAST